MEKQGNAQYTTSPIVGFLDSESCIVGPIIAANVVRGDPPALHNSVQAHQVQGDHWGVDRIVLELETHLDAMFCGWAMGDLYDFTSYFICWDR